MFMRRKRREEEERKKMGRKIKERLMVFPLRALMPFPPLGMISKSVKFYTFRFPSEHVDRQTDRDKITDPAGEPVAVAPCRKLLNYREPRLQTCQYQSSVELHVSGVLMLLLMMLLLLLMLLMVMCRNCGGLSFIRWRRVLCFLH